MGGAAGPPAHTGQGKANEVGVRSAEDGLWRAGSRHRGVHWHSRDKKWRAKIVLDGQRNYLGNFDTEEAAAAAYRVGCVERGLDPEEDRPAHTSEFVGVGWHKAKEKWQSRIDVSARQVHLGLHTDELEAARAYAASRAARDGLLEAPGSSDDAGEIIVAILKEAQTVRRKGGNTAAAVVVVEGCGKHGVELVQDKKSGGWEWRPCSSTG